MYRYLIVPMDEVEDAKVIVSETEMKLNELDELYGEGESKVFELSTIDHDEADIIVEQITLSESLEVTREFV